MGPQTSWGKTRRKAPDTRRPPSSPRFWRKRFNLDRAESTRIPLPVWQTEMALVFKRNNFYLLRVHIAQIGPSLDEVRKFLPQRADQEFAGETQQLRRIALDATGFGVARGEERCGGDPLSSGELGASWGSGVNF